MRVILLGPYPPPYGGISTVVGQLAKLLRRDGRQVAVITGPRSLRGNESWVYSLKGRGLLPRTNKWWFVKQFKPDIINFHTNRWSWSNTYAAQLLGIPLVVTIHGEKAPEAYRSLPPVKRYFARRALQMASFVIAVSEPLFQFVRDLGVSETRTCLIPPLFPLEEETEQRAGSLPGIEGKFGQNCIQIVTSGFYEEVYGFQMIPEVACNLRDRGIEFVWYLAGHGTPEQMTPLRDAIRTRGLEERVILLGELERPDLMRLLRRSSAYVRTKFSDSFGLVVAEAHQLGSYCLVGDNNPFYKEGPRLMIYKTGSADSLFERLTEIIREIDPAAPRSADSPYARIAQANYDRVREIFAQVHRARRT